MEDQQPPNQMNLDLNLGPADEESLPGFMSLDAWLEEPIRRIRQAITQRSAFRRMPSLSRESEWSPHPYTPITRPVVLDLISENGFETGQGSERPSDDEPKACDNNNGLLEDSSFGKKENLENGNGSEWSFFNCNICLDLAKEPVVTCCGHLFCWPCIYRWLNVHSDAKECPVCKGEVNVKNVTPIYGGGSDNRVVEIDSSSLKIPPRPKARRVESWRQSLKRSRRSIALDELDELILQGEAELGSTRYLDPNLGRPANLNYNSLIGQLNHELSTRVDDRDSVSSIAGIIQSESQTVDTAVEIDSRVSSSTLSSRRRNESRVSDVDSAESRVTRRRLH